MSNKSGNKTGRTHSILGPQRDAVAHLFKFVREDFEERLKVSALTDAELVRISWRHPDEKEVIVAELRPQHRPLRPVELERFFHLPVCGRNWARWEAGGSLPAAEAIRRIFDIFLQKGGTLDLDDDLAGLRTLVSPDLLKFARDQAAKLRLRLAEIDAVISSLSAMPPALGLLDAIDQIGEARTQILAELQKIDPAESPQGWPAQAAWLMREAGLAEPLRPGLKNLPTRARSSICDCQTCIEHRQSAKKPRRGFLPKVVPRGFVPKVVPQMD